MHGMPVRHLTFAPGRPAGLDRHWLVTNGLGGFASMTISGAATWHFHGLLVAALPAPLGRTVMLNHLGERAQIGNQPAVELARAEVDPLGESGPLTDFSVVGGVPHWRYKVGDAHVERRVHMPYRQNTVHVAYRHCDGPGPLRITLLPAIAFRSLDRREGATGLEDYSVVVQGRRYEVHGPSGLPPLRMVLDGADATFSLTGGAQWRTSQPLDAERGFDPVNIMWHPGEISFELRPGQCATLVASTEPWNIVRALPPEEGRRQEEERRARVIELTHPVLRDGNFAELVLAADQFVVDPVGRSEDAARAAAAGNELRTIIAGYPWFTDWGRDTMISLEGLTLVTGRVREAREIIEVFTYHIRDGLIPNMFPDGAQEGLYHTADATLWLFHALARYRAYTGDTPFVARLLPRLDAIVDHHLAGTRFNIAVDPADGLLSQGMEGYQLTWMDAKVEDWVVTPRRGKAVEINALWYNALRLLEGWHRELGDAARADVLGVHAERARKSFNQRFPRAGSPSLNDVVDGERGDDASIRPNQVFAISLDHPVLDEARWRPMMELVRDTLLTPVGLRSLAPGSTEYKSRYFGDLRARDAAYHQGTVWAWLIGPYLDAALKSGVHSPAEIPKLIEGLIESVELAGIGTIAEIFDAEPPFTPRGCISQAWSVAEVLRVIHGARTRSSAPATP
jgi:predicted glycogen debranching enzyme